MKNKDKQSIAMKEATIIPVITPLDILYFFNVDLTLSEFNELIADDDRFQKQLTDFINNNFIHYSSSVKLKELLQDYKDSNVRFEPNKFVIDFSNMITLNDNAIIGKRESLGLDLDCDVSEDEKEKILSTVERFN